MSTAADIAYSVSRDGRASVRVYNVAGQRICELVNRPHQPGAYTARWDGSLLPNGTYFIRLETGDAVKVQKVVLQH